ncbi:MAG: hydantoinase/oxoprolinase family protein, partial [Anaerolineae bacterium]|nr:hydantoinase/oxoprolinase family protein [Phycisphaerae bacterium]
SIAYLDAGGALRVGPASAGAKPGPTCYGRGGELPTVTDANLILGRIPREGFLNGAMKLNESAAQRAIEQLANSIGRSVIETALGIVRVAESNMAQAIRAVTSRRGHDPRDFSLVSFGGAGGLHACALAEQLDIPRVIVPPYCGVLSALGMVVAAPVVDVSQTVLHLGEKLDDDRLAAEFGSLSGRSMEQITYESTTSVEAFADVRFAGQSHEITVRVERPSLQFIRDTFLLEYAKLYGQTPRDRAIQLVTLRLRRTGARPEIILPQLTTSGANLQSASLIDAAGQCTSTTVLNRAALLQRTVQSGPLLILDAEATTYVPAGWHVEIRPDGTILLTKIS